MNSQNILDDFKGLDPNDPGAWPLVPRVAALVGVFILAALLFWYFSGSDQLTLLNNAENQEKTLREQWISKQKDAISLTADEKSLERLSSQFSVLLRQLPNRAELDVLLSDITQVGVGRGLQFEYVRPSEEIIKDFYAEMPIAISLTGNYHSIGEFAGDIANIPRIITLDNVNLKADQGVIKFEARAVTYRYLSEEEQSIANTSQQAGRGRAR